MVYSVAFSPDGKYLVSGGSSGGLGELRIWLVAD
jgi:WD40 repeat protein